MSGDVLYNARVLILLLVSSRFSHPFVYKNCIRIIMLRLQGTTFPFSPCGHAFMPVQQGTTGGEEREGVWSEQTEIKSNIDQLMSLLDQLCQNSPPGVWISSTDMLLTVPKTLGTGAITHSRIKVCSHLHLKILLHCYLFIFA